jgi:APA family basic amino acid/polyamine antiporter
VGWGQYFNSLLDTLFGLTLPESIAGPPGEGGTVNLPAVFIVLAVTAILCYGVRESARANTIMVFVKLGVLVLFLVLGVTAFTSDHFTPFAPQGLDGVVTASSVIFFAYIGFDAVSTSGEEARNPGRDLPIAILGSLAIATVLYILVALVAIGALPVSQLAGVEAPLATAIDKGAGFGWASSIISFGALVAITSVVLTVLYGQSRIMFAMCRDGLMPRRWAFVHPRTHTPVYITAVFGLLIAVVAAFVPLKEIAKLVNIGTLFAFVLVNLGVIILRRTRPDLQRGFRVPFVPVFPIIGILLCGYLMKYLDKDTWIRFVVWLIAGLAIYVAYGRSHSLLRKGTVVNPEAELDKS